MHNETSSLVFIQYLTKVFDNVAQSVVLISLEADNRYKVLLVNKTFGTTSGYPNDVIGRYVDDVLPSAVYAQVVRRYKSVIQTKQTVIYSEWMHTPNGRRRFEVKIIPILNSVGECTQFVVMSNDVTEDYMVQRERTAAIALNRYMAGPKRAFIVTDRGLVILRQVNLPEGMKHWEIGTKMPTYLSEADREVFKKCAAEARAEPGQTFSATFTLQSKSGTAHTFTYKLLYNQELRRIIVDIALPK